MKTRQINRSKRHSSGCGNNGSCGWCRGSRLYSNVHRAPVPGRLADALAEVEAANDEVRCPTCEQVQLADDAELGRLGSLGHYRCVFCGWQWADGEDY